MTKLLEVGINVSFSAELCFLFLACPPEGLGPDFHEFLDTIFYELVKK